MYVEEGWCTFPTVCFAALWLSPSSISKRCCWLASRLKGGKLAFTLPYWRAGCWWELASNKIRETAGTWNQKLYCHQHTVDSRSHTIKPFGMPNLTFHCFLQEPMKKVQHIIYIYIQIGLQDFFLLGIPVFMLYTHTGMLVGERTRESEGRGTEKWTGSMTWTSLPSRSNSWALTAATTVKSVQLFSPPT